MFATAVRETRVSLVALAFIIEREWMNMRSIIPKAMGHCAVLAALLGTAVPLAAPREVAPRGKPASRTPP